MTENIAYFFPGQGAQFVGMGKSLLQASPRAQTIFSRGNEVLGWDILDICQNGPEDSLNSTRVSQPAIFLLSMAVLDTMAEKAGSSEPFGRSLTASATAGLSLGEYSALVFAGSLEFEEALKIVSARGQFMQDACDETPGGMTSLMGLEVSRVEDAVKNAQSVGKVGIANYNSPDQTVVSGEIEAVKKAVELATEMGCRRTVPLRVAGAYHSGLMASATQKLKSMLNEISIAPPRCPFYSNVSGQRVSNPEVIREGLIQQVESSVRWDAILRDILATGIHEALEVGPGKVLRGLARNVDRSFKVNCVCEYDEIDKLFVNCG